MSKIITHLMASRVAQAGVFNDVKSLSDLDRAIIRYAKDATCTGKESPEESVDMDDTYNNRAGWAYEIFVEMFLKCGLKDDPTFGVVDVQGTSQNKFNGGFDFTAKDAFGDLVLIQAKFRSNPLTSFTRHELGTFVSWADELGVPASRRILFTNLKHVPRTNNFSVFHFSYSGGIKQLRTFGRSEQDAIIVRNPGFWT